MLGGKIKSLFKKKLGGQLACAARRQPRGRQGLNGPLMHTRSVGVLPSLGMRASV